jgi:hypothetical protein
MGESGVVTTSQESARSAQTKIMPLKTFHLRASNARGCSHLSTTLSRCRTAFRSFLVDAAAGSVCDAVVHFDGIAAYQLFVVDFQTPKNPPGLEA